MIGIGGGAGGIWGNRRGGRRRLSLSRGRNVATAIEKGIAWIVAQQSPGGAFEAKKIARQGAAKKNSSPATQGLSRVGLTALCVLPLLGDGNSLRNGPHSKATKKAILYLRGQQQVSGAFADTVLEHSLATYAMTEAWILSAHRSLRKNVERSIEHLAKVQNEDGGFSHARKGQASCMFTTCHAVLALMSAKIRGMQSGQAALEKAFKYLASVSTKGGTSSGSLVSPLAMGPHAKETIVAATYMGRLAKGDKAQSIRWMRDASTVIVDALADDAAALEDPVLAYLGSHALYQAGGRAWARCKQALMSVARSQRRNGKHAGSWEPQGKGALRGGRLYATALSTLALQSYYRYTVFTR